MDLERIEAIARDLRRTREELEQMKANALAKDEIEAANLINAILRDRFPVHAKTGGGRTPTEVSFKGRTETFESGKDGYLWLVDQFHSFRPSVLEEFLELVRTPSSESKGCRFATSPAGLFPAGSKRSGDPRYYSGLSGGWFADTNINHDDKFAALLKLSHVCKLEYPTDWEFKPIGSTEQLREHQKAVVRAKEMLEEIVRMKNKLEELDREKKRLEELLRAKREA